MSLAVHKCILNIHSFVTGLIRAPSLSGIEHRTFGMDCNSCTGASLICMKYVLQHLYMRSFFLCSSPSSDYHGCSSTPLVLSSTSACTQPLTHKEECFSRICTTSCWKPVSCQDSRLLFLNKNWDGWKSRPAKMSDTTLTSYSKSNQSIAYKIWQPGLIWTAMNRERVSIMWDLGCSGKIVNSQTYLLESVIFFSLEFGIHSSESWIKNITKLESMSHKHNNDSFSCLVSLIQKYLFSERFSSKDDYRELVFERICICIYLYSSAPQCYQNAAPSLKFIFKCAIHCPCSE